MQSSYLLYTVQILHMCRLVIVDIRCGIAIGCASPSARSMVRIRAQFYSAHGPRPGAGVRERQPVNTQVCSHRGLKGSVVALQGAPIAGTVRTRARLLACLISGCRRRKRDRVEQRSPRLGAACFIREEKVGKSVLVQDRRPPLAVGLARVDDEAPATPVGVRVEARRAERACAVPIVKMAARHRAETCQVDVDERRLAIGHKMNE